MEAKSFLHSDEQHREASGMEKKGRKGEKTYHGKTMMKTTIDGWMDGWTKLNLQQTIFLSQTLCLTFSPKP